MLIIRGQKVYRGYTKCRGENIVQGNWKVVWQLLRMKIASAADKVFLFEMLDSLMGRFCHYNTTPLTYRPDIERIKEGNDINCTRALWKRYQF